jgi:hypothetical protein
MPEIFRVFGFRFLFYSNDHLPIHIHVRNGDGEAKFSVKPVQLVVKQRNEIERFEDSRRIGRRERRHY